MRLWGSRTTLLLLYSKPILKEKKLFCGLNGFEPGITLNHMVRDFASLIGSLLTQLLHTLRQSVSVYGTGKITVRVALNMDRLPVFFFCILMNLCFVMYYILHF